MHTEILPRTGLGVVALVIALGASVTAQEPNTATGTLTFNAHDPGTYPIQMSMPVPNSLAIALSGAPSAAGMPWILVRANDLMVPGFVLGSETVDLDLTSLNFIIDGTRPSASLFNAFANLSSGSTGSLTLPVTGTVLAPTSLGAFQAVIVDPAAAVGFTLTAATKLTLVPFSPFGTVTYSRGSSTGAHTAFSMTTPHTPSANTAMPSSFEIRSPKLAGFQPFHNTASHPWWRKDFASLPPGLTAMLVNENPSFQYVKTQHGDLYAFRNTAAVPNEYAFALRSAAGLAPIAATVAPGLGPTGLGFPFESEIQVQNNRFAYVIDPDAPATDRLMLASLDGATLSGGVETMDVTPAGITGIAEESLTLTHHNLFFIARDISAPFTGQLFSAPIDGSAAATAVSIPIGPTMGGAPVNFVHAELRYSADRSMVVFQGGTLDGSIEDLYMITDTAPGIYTVTNLSAFPVIGGTRRILAFGDDTSGWDNLLAISPGNQRVAFVETSGAQHDALHVVSVAAPGVVTKVSTGTNFIFTLDQVVELHWASDTVLLFFVGSTTDEMDLYSYDVTTSIVTNLTQTSGITSTPFGLGATIDPGEIFFNVARTHMYWFRDDGTDGSGNSTKNLIAVNLATLAITDVTGSEFASGTCPNADFAGTAFGPSYHLQLAKNSADVAFVSELATATDENVFAFNADSPGSAVVCTNNLGSSWNLIESMSIEDSGASVAYGDTSGSSGHEEIYRALTGIGASAILLYTPPASVVGGSVTEGTIRWTANGQLMFSYGSNFPWSNPTDATLMLWDPGQGAIPLDSTSGGYWIYSP